MSRMGSGVFGDGGLRDWSSQASEFCYRRLAEDAFEKILRITSSRWVFISYSEDAHVEPSKLMHMLSKYGTVELQEQPLERFRSNDRVARQGHVREHLYALEMSDVGAIKSGRTMDKETESV